jgi:hypothetical protein
MDSTPRHRAAEADFRRLLEDAGLDPPDRVEYADDSLAFFWNGPKVAVVVDLDDAEAPVVAVNGQCAPGSMTPDS